MATYTEQGIEAARQGDRARAKGLLSLAVKENPNDERAWSWLFGVVDEPAQKKYCIERVLQLNPNNPKARQALAQLTGSVMPPVERDSPPAPSVYVPATSSSVPAEPANAPAAFPNPSAAFTSEPAEEPDQTLPDLPSRFQEKPQKRGGLGMTIGLVAFAALCMMCGLCGVFYPMIQKSLEAAFPSTLNNQPLGGLLTLHQVGERVQVGSQVITLNRVERQGDMVVANFSIENNGNTWLMVSPFIFAAIDSGNNALTQDVSACNEVLNTQVDPGKSLTGNICWEGFSNPPLRILYTGELMGSTVMWEASP